MKHFLRHIFLLLALFVATASAWAECYILNSPTEIKIEWKNADTNKNGNYSSEYSFDGPCAQLTFKYRLDAITDASNWHKITVMGLNNDNQWIELGNTGEIFNAGTKTAMFDLSSYANKISAIKFKRTANSGGFLGANNGKKDVLIREITIKRYTSIAASSIDPFPETKLESETASQNVTVTYSNIGNNYSITQENTTDFSIEKLPFDYSSCGGEMYFKITFHPKGNVAGVRTGSVTIAGNGDGKSNDNTSVKINLTGKATGEPEHRWDGETAFLVDESVDLSTWYSSNKNGARTYEIVSFSPDDETGVTPTLNGNTIKLTRAGKLTVRMKQDAHDIYSYKESTQTFKISKHNSNFKWNNPDNLQCYVDDFCDEAFLFSRSSDLPLTITSSNPNVVSYQDGTFTAVGAGTAVITVKQDKHYKWTEFEETYTIHVNKYDVSATISQESALWNDLIDNAFSVSYGLQDYTVTSYNTNIAQYLSGNKIQTYFTSGTVQFRIFRAEDRKFKELNQTFTLNVQPAGGCLVLEPCSGSYSAESFGSYEPAGFTGVPNQLTFKAENQYVLGLAGRGSIVVQQYLNNGWTDITSIAWEELGKDYDSEGLKPFGPYNLDEKATKVRFYTRNGTYKRYFQDVQVTRKTYLRPSATELTLPQTTIGKPVSASFDLNWSTCSDDIKLVSNNDLFEVGTTQINTTAHTGTTNNILVRFKGANEPGTYSAVITIYDQSQSKEVHVSCVVKDRLATTIVYTGETQYSETQDCIEGKFSVVDENGNTVTGANIVLTSSNEDILSICGNAGFMPHCGGQVTLAAHFEGDDTYEACSLSVEITVPYCQREIVWNTSYLNFATDENGYIDEKRVLDATINPESEITYQLHAVTSTPFAEIVEENGKYFVRVFGEGHGYIVATAKECSFAGRMYDATYKIKEVRVSGAGACDPNSLLIWGDGDTEPFVYKYSTNSSERTRIYHLTGLPAETMTFGAHAASSSYENRLVISFSTESEGDNWIGEHKQTVVSGSSYNWNYSCPVPEGAKRVRFQSEATLTIYFNGVTIPQQTYIRPSVESIEISDAIVNVPFAPITFSVDYSNVRLLQWKVSNNHDLGLKVVANQEVNNDCDLYGTYTFTLTGESPYPQSNVTETITFYTSAGDVVNIPVTVTATLSEPFYFNVKDHGDVTVSSNWTYQGSTNHGMIPDKRFPIVISKPLTINESELVAYGVTIAEGGSVNIQPNGGLTLHAGGFTEGVTKDNFTILNNQDGVGYVRVSPYFTREVEGTMPNITVQYTTRAMAGGAKDQVWQYVGAPGNNMQMSNDGVMVYLWSEKDGWVYSDTHMTPFAGYALTRTAEGSGIYNISAQPINGNHTIDLTYTQGAMEGGNLFVNSYLAPIDVTKFTDDTNDFEGDIEKTFYLFNSGSWEQWQGQGGSTNTMVNGSSAGQYYAIAPFSAAFTASEEQKVIPPMQGVYVVVGENGGKIKLQYNKHIFHANTKDMNRPMRAPQEEMDNFMRLRLQVNSQNSGADRMYVIQHENTTRGYDNGYDAKNILAEGQANIYTNEVDGQMEISVADKIDSTFIGFTAGEDSVYTLTFTSLVGQDMYLHDLVEDSLFLLVEDGQYTFSAQPNSVNDMRFQLILHPELLGQDEPEDNMTTGMDNVMSSARVWVNDKRIYIATAPQNSTIAVYTVSGMCITSPLTIHEAPCTVDLSHLPTGVYVLRLNNQAYKFVCK